MKYVYLGIILIYLNIIQIAAQNLIKIDTSKCVFLGYMLLLQEDIELEHIKQATQIYEYLDKAKSLEEVKFLKTEGFIELPYLDILFYTITNHIGEYGIACVIDDGIYSVYRVKGFMYNDFPLLYANPFIAQMLNDDIPPIKVENIDIDGLKLAIKDTNLTQYHECLATCRSKWKVVIVEYANETFAKAAWEKEQLYGGKKENMAIFKWKR